MKNPVRVALGLGFSRFVPTSRPQLVRKSLRSAAFLWLVILLLPSTIFSQQAQWRFLPGTAGIKINDIDLYPTDPDTLYALGDISATGGKFLRSTNGGENWDTLTSPDNLNMILGAVKVDPSDSRLIYLSYFPLVGVQPGLNVIKLSRDGGLSWDSLFSKRDWEAPVAELNPASQTTAYLGLGSGHVKRTTDRGYVWEDLTLIPEAMGLTSLAIAASDPSVLYLGSYTGVFKSTDGGATWNLLPLPFKTAPSWSSVLVDPSNSSVIYAGLLEYPAGNLYKSTDGGSTWDTINDGIDDSSRSVRVLAMNPRNHNDILAGTGAPRLVFRTTNGGTSWARFDQGLPNAGHTRAIVFDTLNNRIFLGTNSGIYVLDSLVAGVQSRDPPSWKMRLDQNFPNPFNPRTTIHFSIEFAGGVSLKIYDLMGREIEQLYSGWTEPGNHQITFSLRGLAGGIYFLRLSMSKKSFPDSAIEESIVRKMTLIK